MAYEATLIGGPADGKVVELVGPVHSHAHRLHPRRFGLIKGVYRWDRNKAGKLIGVFAGYYFRGKQVDSQGRRWRQA